MAAHGGDRHLYAIVHQGPRESHKDGGRTIHVVNVDTHARVRTLHTREAVSVIAVSSDDHPLLYAASPEATNLMIHDAHSGKLKHTVPEAGTSIMYLTTH